jgi:membrane-bound lytic murein transglycosylase MltF
MMTKEEKAAWFAQVESKKKIIADMERFMNSSKLDDINLDNFIESTLNRNA